jgi:hypothetical protein
MSWRNLHCLAVLPLLPLSPQGLEENLEDRGSEGRTACAGGTEIFPLNAVRCENQTGHTDVLCVQVFYR